MKIALLGAASHRGNSLRLGCEVLVQCVYKETVHRHTAAYPAGYLLCVLQGVPYTPTLPPTVRPSVLTRCARCKTHDSFLLRFLLLRSSHCHVILLGVGE